jgi:hypothetical protein
MEGTPNNFQVTHYHSRGREFITIMEKLGNPHFNECRRFPREFAAGYQQARAKRVG